MAVLEKMAWLFLRKNMTVTVVILAVFAARWVLRRFPKKYSYVLWSVVGIRMLVELPVRSVFSVFHVLPFGRWMGQLAAGLAAHGGWHLADAAGGSMVSQAEMMAQAGTAGGSVMAVQADMAAQVGTATGAAVQTADAAAWTADVTTGVTAQAGTAAEAAASLHALGIWLGILLILYVMGVYVVLAVGELSYLQFRNRIRQAVHLRDNIWECDNISTPFVLGLFAPKVYIPFRMDGKSMTYVLRHEQYHIRRRDHWVKLGAYLLLAAYWVNPFAWLAYFAFVRDQEMSCDEAVISMSGAAGRREYSELLLAFATGHRMSGFSPIAFGETDASRRIKNILNYKKPGFWAGIACIGLVTAIAVGCLTNDVQDTQKSENGYAATPEGIAADQENAADAQGTAEAENRMAAVQARLEELAALNEKVKKNHAAKEVEYRVAEDEWEKSTGGFETWAKAIAGRDAETILKLSTEKVQDQMEEEGLLVRQGGLTYIGGGNSWTRLDECAWMIRYGSWGSNTLYASSQRGEALIYYAIPADDLHLISCREKLIAKRDLADEDNFMTVYEERMECFRDIEDKRSFEAAYPTALTQQGLLDYSQNGYGELLNFAAKQDPEKYSRLFDPAEAARYLLNLSADESRVRVTSKTRTYNLQPDKVTVAEITFVEEGKTVTIRMDRPWGEDGIWIPGKEM